MPRVMRKMPEVVEQKPQLVEGKPVKPGRSIQVEPRDALVDLRMAEVKIFDELGPRVRQVDLRFESRLEGDFTKVVVIRTKMLPRLKLLLVGSEIEVRVEERVVRDMPVAVG